MLTQFEAGILQQTSDKLYTDRGARLWMVYVDSFEGLQPLKWVENTARANGVAGSDVVLAIATADRPYCLTAPAFTASGKGAAVEMVRQDLLAPAVANGE
ncbi:TPM domain-containing protein [Mycobacterium genavense]|uniref:TPM domain-containing protein n=1 Tax=Mycobacterium genavense TaxID=36812 RepID=UPI0004727A1F|nr:TPM domain-containing protein [Mycobacterium genavense]